MNKLSLALVGPLAAVLVLSSSGCNRDRPNARTPGSNEAASSNVAGAQYVFGQAAAPFQTPPVLQGTPDIATIVDKTKETVVNITTSSKGRMPNTDIDPFEFFFRQPFGGGGPPPGFSPFERRQQTLRRALGTGFIVDAGGYVVTNHHVVEGADDISVKLYDGRELKATVAGKDPKLDVAVLKLEGAGKVPAVVFGDSDKLRVGEYVVAMGNPFGLGNTVTMGIVSAKDRTIGAGPYDDFIQTDASINPGNSGGPLFNLLGEVVGMNTAIHAQGQGIGFAIPANIMKDVILQLRETGHVSRGRLGLVFQPVTEEISRAMGRTGSVGALVSEVEPGGPADKSGIKSGDVILKVGDDQVKEGTQLPRLVARHQPGAVVPVTLSRQGKEQTVQVTLGAIDEDESPRAKPASGRAPDQEGSNDFGVRLQAGRDGVQVIGVTGDNAANLQRGDIIQQVDGKAVSTVAQVASALNQAAKENRPALVKVRRDDRTLFTTVTGKK